MKKIRPLTDEQKNLAMDFIAKFHPIIKFIRSSLRHEYRRSQEAGFTDDEIDHLGCIGVMNAARVFKPELGWQLSTLAWHHIRAALQVARRTRSVRTVSGDAMCGEELSFLSTVPSRAQDVDHEDRDLARSRLNDALGKMAERHAAIIIMRFGLDGKGGRTLKEVAADLRISRERVRQCEEIALAELCKILTSEAAGPQPA